MDFYEEVTRVYDKGVKIVYENIGFEIIYIHSIISNFPKRKYGTVAMESFLEEFKSKDIYIFSTDELGVKREVLDSWYERLGFIKDNNKELPYNVTHCKFKRKGGE